MKTERKEYQGVSPTQPDLWIDKKMDQFVKSKGGRIFAGLTALTVATANAACANAQPTNKPPETAPVPSGVPTLGPTPTETLIPTATNTPTPTETEIPSPTPERYPFDMTKLHNFPDSYEKLVSNPEKFLESPDPFLYLKAFNEWWTELTDLMGDQTKLEPNLRISSVTHDLPSYTIIGSEDRQPMPKPEFFYFKHGTMIYPVPIFTLIDTRDQDLRTWAVILTNTGRGRSGFLTLDDLNSGRLIKGIVIFRVENKVYPYPEDTNRLIALGLVGDPAQPDNGYQIGGGDVRFWP